MRNKMSRTALKLLESSTKKHLLGNLRKLVNIFANQSILTFLWVKGEPVLGGPKLSGFRNFF